MMGMATCEYCHVEFPAGGSRGPLPRFCSTSHRQMAYRKRRLARLTGAAGKLGEAQREARAIVAGSDDPTRYVKAWALLDAAVTAHVGTTGKPPASLVDEPEPEPVVESEPSRPARVPCPECGRQIAPTSRNHEQQLVTEGYQYFYRLRTHKTGKGGPVCTGRTTPCDKNGQPLLVGL